MEQTGIKETGELLIFLARFGDAINVALRDGKIDFTDVGVLFDPIMASRAAFNDVKLVPAELADLSSSEALQLSNLIADELILDDERAEILTEKGLALATALIAFVNELRGAVDVEPFES